MLGSAALAPLFTETPTAFNKVTRISAGNSFRAATLYKALLELDGQSKIAFDSSDEDPIRQLLEAEGIHDILQTDPNIAKKVQEIGTMPGGEALCSFILCDLITKAYYQDGGGNLIVVDARDPVGHMRRNNILGFKEGQVDPRSIVPFYIDTPVVPAAWRMPGDFNKNVVEVSNRRHTDATREVNPVVRPTILHDDFDDWVKQFDFDAMTDVPAPLRIDNSQHREPEDLQQLGSFIARYANVVGFCLREIKVTV